MLLAWCKRVAAAAASLQQLAAAGVLCSLGLHSQPPTLHRRRSCCVLSLPALRCRDNLEDDLSVWRNVSLTNQHLKAFKAAHKEDDLNKWVAAGWLGRARPRCLHAAPRGRACPDASVWRRAEAAAPKLQRAQQRAPAVLAAAQDLGPELACAAAANRCWPQVAHVLREPAGLPFPGQGDRHLHRLQRPCAQLARCCWQLLRCLLSAARAHAVLPGRCRPWGRGRHVSPLLRVCPRPAPRR
jgi:hypothetical protein